jgi:hypothetical protein
VPSRRKADKGEIQRVRLSFDRVETGRTAIAVLLDDLESTRRIAEETRSVQEELKATDPGGDLTL